MKIAGRSNPVLDTLSLYSPAVLGVLLMLPRLAAPQFGLFDDGQTITNATQVFQGNWSVIFENAYGRTRPVYWLFYSLIYKMAGSNPFWFYMVNLAVFVVTILAVIGLVSSLGGSRRQAWCAGLFFTLADPVIEAIYTLSKAEMLQMALMLSAILCFARLIRQPRPWKTWGSITAMVILTLVATLSKEVTLIGAAITAGWLVIGWGTSWISRRKPVEPVSTWVDSRRYIPALLVFLGAQAAAGLVFLIIRLVATGAAGIQKTPTSYAANFNLSFDKLETNFVHWSGWLLHDFPYLIIILIVLLVWVVRRKRLPQPALLLGAAVWMAAWFLFYLPWRFIVDYYLLPFAIGSSIVAGVVAGQVVEEMKNAPTHTRAIYWAGLLIFLALWGVTLVNNVTNAHIQLAVDDANTAMLTSVAATVPTGGQVLLNLSPQSEYGDEIKMHLKLIQLRPDLLVTFFNSKTLAQAQASGQPYLIISPQLTNQQILSVRMGVSEPDVRAANESLSAQVNTLQLQKTPFLRQFNLFSIDLPRLMCIVLPKDSYCAKNSAILDQRLFNFGWTVYQTEQP